MPAACNSSSLKRRMDLTPPAILRQNASTLFAPGKRPDRPINANAVSYAVSCVIKPLSSRSSGCLHTLFQALAAFLASFMPFLDKLCFPALLHIVRQRAHRWSFVEDVSRERVRLQRSAQASHQVNAHQRIPAQLEKVIVDAYRRNTEQLLPDGCYLPFKFTARRHIGAAQRRARVQFSSLLPLPLPFQN